MRHSASFTSISWIPSEAIPGAFKIPFLLGIGHYDPPPPDHIKDLEGLHRAGGFRYANRLRAFVEVQEGRIVDAGYEGGGLVSPTLATLGLKTVAIPPVVYPEIKKEPEFGDGSVRFVQTVGARTSAVLEAATNRTRTDAHSSRRRRRRALPGTRRDVPRLCERPSRGRSRPGCCSRRESRPRRGDLVALSGGHEQAMGLLDEAIDLARVTGHRHREAALLNNLADLHHRSGSTEAAEETLTKAVTLFSDIDSQQWEPELWLISHW